MPPPRVVVVATAVGHDGVPHAGGTYIRHLCTLLEPLVDLVLMAPGTRTNRDAALRPGAPRRTVPLGLEPASWWGGRIVNRVSLRGDGYWRKWDPGLPYLPLVVGLARSADARRLIRDADVIDLQWSDSVRLVHLMRRMNPRARVVGTFHDVMSQSFAREPQETWLARRYWRGVARRSRRHERRMVRVLDEVLVFSDKDIGLLGSPAHARVVRPPLAEASAPRHEVPGGDAPTVLLVSYLSRDENNKAALWAVGEVWPLVSSQVPGARLRLVGGGATDELRELAGRTERVELAGFVDDLDAEYAAASVCLVPVLQGAGVKFKTIEALLHGVPTVTTNVGSEGTGPDDLFSAVVDTREGLAAALVAALQDLASAQRVADAAQDWAQVEFSKQRFVDTVLSAWGLVADHGQAGATRPR